MKIFKKEKKEIAKNEVEETALNIINNAEILVSDDFKTLTEMKEELKDVFLTSQVFRTRTEMEVSVLNDIKHPTPDSKYWQSMREQKVMFSELVMLSYEYRKNQVEIKQLQRKLKKEKDDLEQELLKIEIEKKMYIAKTEEKTAKDRIRELKQWHEIKERLVPQLSAGINDCDDHQLVSYTQRWIRQFKTMLDKGSPSERANLIGQMESGLKLCKEKGLIDKVLVTEQDKKQFGNFIKVIPIDESDNS